MTLRFVHTADLHFGSPFAGVEEASPDVARALEESSYRTFDRTVDLCISEAVDALLVAGDVFEGSTERLKAQSHFTKALFRLHDAGIPSFVCHGNHDPLDFWPSDLTFPSTCHRFGAEIEDVPLDPRQPERAIVTGISYPINDVTENLALRFTSRDADAFRIGLLHCNVGGDANHASYSPCSVNDLTQCGIDYWALGHIHNRKIIQGHSPAIVYPGIPQGRHPGEPGARGVSLVTVDDRKRIDIDFRPVDVIRWGRTRLDISAVRSMPDLVDSIVATLEKELAAAEGRSLICSVKLEGDSSLRETFTGEDAAKELVRKVNARLSLDEPWIWCRRAGLH